VTVTLFIAYLLLYIHDYSVLWYIAVFLLWLLHLSVTHSGRIGHQ